MWFIAITSLECIIFLQYFFLLLPKAGLCNQKLDGKTLLGFFFVFTSWISCNTRAKSNFTGGYRRVGMFIPDHCSNWKHADDS